MISFIGDISFIIDEPKQHLEHEFEGVFLFIALIIDRQSMYFILDVMHKRYVEGDVLNEK